jgi:hypothetical protein
MKTTIAPLAALAALALGAGTASAASPTYCALYAKEFAKLAIAEGMAGIAQQRIHKRAYHICLNTDDEPALPTSYAEATSSGTGGPFVVDKQQSSANTDATPAAAAAVAQPEGKKQAAGKAPVEPTTTLAPEPQPAQKNASTTPATPLARVAGLVWNLKDPKRPTASASILGGSGLPMWSPEWETWCKERFPNTFNPKTGTVRIGSGPRIKC